MLIFRRRNGARALCKAPALSVMLNRMLVRSAPVGGGGDSNSVGVTASGRYPIINRANTATIAQARKSLETSKADLETAEQDLIVRVAQAYFDVLSAADNLRSSQAEKSALDRQLDQAKQRMGSGVAAICAVNALAAALVPRNQSER